MHPFAQSVPSYQASSAHQVNHSDLLHYHKDNQQSVEPIAKSQLRLELADVG